MCMKDNPKGVWISAETPPVTRKVGLILCVSGEHYDHAIIIDGLNSYENGKWYIQGIYSDAITVHAWFEIPGYEE